MYNKIDMKKLLIFFLLALTSANVTAQENRAFNAYGNNENNPLWGTKDYFFETLTTIDFGDSIKSLNGQNRPNARLISNLIFDQQGSIEDELQLTNFTWAFGQFIDHDITLASVDYSEKIFVTVPSNDYYFTPGSQIPVFRTLAAHGTGTDVFNPRKFNNEITAYLDASNVYGSDKDRSDWLRTFKDGKLKTSEGNLLPWNTITSEFNEKIDPKTPALANDTQVNDKLFVGGDVRANENPLLIAFHTLFVREHNRLCDVIISENPTWSDEQIYQSAKRKVTAYYQSIIFNEWLPIQGISLPKYSGYNPEINSGISNLFSAVAFRLGHTLISDIITRIDDKGNDTKQGNIELKECYFNPLIVKISGGIEPFLKGMAAKPQQKLDTKMVDGVRNYLFGDPDFGGLDLASINIMRCRERGISDYNTIRADFDLAKVNDFNEITKDTDLANNLKFLYGNVDNIDAYVGLLAEDHIENSIFGITLLTILKDQFLRLRDGDRFYYQNDPAFTEDEKIEIKNTKLSDIILRNTHLTSMPYHVFTLKSDLPIGGPEVPQFQLRAIPYPNPVRTTFRIKTWVEKASIVELKLFDTNGKVIIKRTQELFKGENFLEDFDLTDYPNGIYNLYLEIDNDYNILKIVKD